MIEGPEPDARPALATGAPLPDRRPPPVLIDAIAARLELWPRGMLWTCDGSGRLDGQSYQTLWRRSLDIAAGLAAQGIGPGRILGLAVQSALDFVPAFWAGLRSGCTVLPLTGRAGQGRGEALAQVLAAVSETVVVAEDGSRAGEVAERLGLGFLAIEGLERAGAGARPAPARPVKGPACLLPTSGSTGRMKLAALPEAVLIRRQFQRQGPADDPEDSRLFAFDLDTVTGLSLAFLGSPRHVLVAPAMAAGRPALLAEAIDAHRITRVALTCSLAGLLAEAIERAGPAWDLSSLRQVNLGGETVAPEVAMRLADAAERCGARDLQIFAAYGSTETGNLATGARVPRVPPGKTPPPLFLGNASRGVTLRIVSEDGAVLREGEIGAIEVLAPGLMFSGYWGEDSATAAAFSPDGWYRTGDLGSLEGGQVQLHGRVKEIIIARGAKHALADIDAVLQAALRQARPAGAGDRVLSYALRRPGAATEQLAAAVFSGEPLEPGERKTLESALRRAAAGRFGLGLKTFAYAPIERLPLGPGGKVMRRELAALLAVASDPAADARTSADDDWLAALWSQVLACPGPVTSASDFLELGGDSLASAQLFAALETRLGRRVGPDRFFAAPTFGNLRRLVEDHTVASVPVPAAPEPDWPLPSALRDKLLVRMEAWPGERPTRGRLAAGLNLSGKRPPLVWIFQGGEEFAAFGEALGPHQPLYGFRSGHLVFRYTEDRIQQVALAYVHEVLEACPTGPLALGGNCQGGIIALAMAQHLVRRQRPPNLLVLMEWTFRLHPYPGQVLFLHGADSARDDPRLGHPEQACRQLLGRFERQEIPGAHGGFFWPGNVERLAAIVSDRLPDR